MLRFQEGQYWGRIVAQGLEKAKTGSVSATLVVEILGRINSAEPDGDLLPCASGRAYLRIWLTEKNMTRAKKDLAAIGYERESLRFIDPGADAHEDLTGREFAFSCRHGKDADGLSREEWSVARGAEVAGETPEAKEIRALDALFGNGKPSTGAKRQTKPQVPAEPLQAPAVAATKDGDIPF